MAQISVSVNGQNYMLACDDGEEKHLSELARAIDGRITDIRRDVKSAGESQLLLMAGLLLADELEIAGERIRDLEEQLAGLKGEFLEGGASDDTAAILKVNEEKLAGMLESAARRMEDIAGRLR
jgi:cell division protein ZapA